VLDFAYYSGWRRNEILGLWWVYKVAISGAASMTKKASPAARRDALMADISNNDPGFCRRSVHEYFSYLDRYKTVAPRLCKSGVKSWVVFGHNDEIGLQDHERSVLARERTTQRAPKSLGAWLVEDVSVFRFEGRRFSSIAVSSVPRMRAIDVRSLRWASCEAPRISPTHLPVFPDHPSCRAFRRAQRP
jgi:hypothetical protein